MHNIKFWFYNLYLDIVGNVRDLFSFLFPFLRRIHVDEDPVFPEQTEETPSSSRVTIDQQEVGPNWLQLVAGLVKEFVLNSADMLRFFSPFNRVEKTPTSVSRNRHFRIQISLIVFGLLFFVTVVFVFAPRESGWTDKEKTDLRLAIANHDQKTIEQYLNKFKGLERATPPELKLGFAEFLYQHDDKPEALRLLESLAPNDQPGFPPANRIRANLLLNQLVSLPQNEEHGELLQQIQFHLKQGGTDNTADSHMNWARYYIAVKQANRALPYMEKAAEINPQFLLALTQLYQQLNEADAARKTLEKARGTYSEFVRKGNATPSDVLALSAAAMVLGKLDEAEAWLVAAIKNNADPVLLKQLSALYVMRFDEAISENPPRVRTPLLVQAIKHTPAHESALARFEMIASRTDVSASDREIAKRVFEQLVQRGERLGKAHFVLSTIALRDGDKTSGLRELEESIRYPDVPNTAWNNLAWLLAIEEKRDLERSQEFIEKAIRAEPHNLRFRDTYAHILMERGRYQESLIEFESILESQSEKQLIHEKIARLYAKLGNERMAMLHQERAQQLSTKSKK